MRLDFSILLVTRVEITIYIFESHFSFNSKIIYIKVGVYCFLECDVLWGVWDVEGVY